MVQRYGMISLPMSTFINQLITSRDLWRNIYNFTKNVSDVLSGSNGIEHLDDAAHPTCRTCPSIFDI